MIPGDLHGIDLARYFDHCVEVAAREFGFSPDALPTRFDVQFHESVPTFHKHDTGSTIFLQRSQYVSQHRFQAGHEVTHWLLTPSFTPDVYHWTHEMLCDEISVRCLRESGLVDGESVAAANADILRNRAGEATLHKMLTTPLVRPYDWVFGRAYVVGQQLQRDAGWEAVKKLGTLYRADGNPDVKGWIDSLPDRERKRVIGTLGKPDSSWI